MDEGYVSEDERIVLSTLRMPYFSKVHLGSSSKVPSSRKWRPVLEGLAKVEMKRPRDWKAPWRT